MKGKITIFTMAIMLIAGTATAAGTCENSCGSMGSGDNPEFCYCDAICFLNLDCCTDVCDFCEDLYPAPEQCNKTCEPDTTCADLGLACGAHPDCPWIPEACGACGDGEYCNAGTCAPNPCEADKIPGCFGACELASWLGDNICDTNFNCAETNWDNGDCEPCEPVCGDMECGLDPECGMLCGTCNEGSCYEGACWDGGGCDVQDTPGCDGCACEDCVFGLYPHCEDTAWDIDCVSACLLYCGGCGDQAGCGDGACDFPENCNTCADDCGCPAGLACGYNEELQDFECLEGSCKDGMEVGCCDGDVLNICFPGLGFMAFDCTEDGNVCGWYAGDELNVPRYYCGTEAQLVDEDPSGVYPAACEDFTCTADCTDLDCGPDPICGEDCGTCDEGDTCEDGICLPPCDPDCTDADCGDDDGCGGLCDGPCPEDDVCNAGVCEPCVPDCTGLECGPDPICGDKCGNCGDGQICNAGVCEDCTPDCAALECGPDPVCGEECGPCEDGELCEDGVCALPCDPDCTDAACGDDDGCGGLCDGPCPEEDDVCNAGVCEPCVPDCTGLECGLDPICGDKCGNCGDGQICNAGVCEDCTADCTGLDCGPDPVCGFECGTCVDGYSCDAGLCVEDMPPMDTCEGNCGANTDDAICVCDPDCFEIGDCCDDICDFCAEDYPEDCGGVCEPDCTGLECGADPVCGEECGPCDAGFTCDAGACIEDVVAPDCADDADCADGEVCVNGFCEPDEGPCVPDCTGLECGDDGCDGSCGDCDKGFECLAGVCMLEIDEDIVDGGCTVDSDCDDGEVCNADGMCEAEGGGDGGDTGGSDPKCTSSPNSNPLSGLLVLFALMGLAVIRRVHA